MNHEVVCRNPPSFAPAARTARWITRGATALLLAAGAGTATTAWFANQHAAAQTKHKFQQKEVTDRVASADANALRCDKENLGKDIEALKQTKKVLDAAAKEGAVPAMAADAKALDEAIDRFERVLRRCKDTHKATGPAGQTYGFANAVDADAAVTGIADAKAAAQACDHARYARILELIRAQVRRTTDPAAKDALRQLERDLFAAAEELFKHCHEPKKADQPKEAAKTEPAKTGTGTGTDQPVKPPEAPKAPADSPEHGSIPTFKFRGEIFANVAHMPQFGAGTAINGGRHSIVDSPGTPTGAGFNFGLDIPTTVDLFGFGREPWWSIDIGFSRATGSSTGSLAPGAATTGFDYIAPNPASGFIFISHFLNGQVVYIDSERNQFDAELLFNKGIQMTFNTMVPKTKVEGSIGVGFQFRAIWDSHQVNQSIINFPDVTSTLNLDSSTFFIAPKAMLRAEYEVGRFEFYVGAYVAPGLAIGSGRAEQQARCPACAASEQSVNLGRNDSFVKFAVSTGARAWVSYDVTPAVRARAFAGYDYFSSTARWRLDSGNAHLKGGSTGTWRIGLGLSMRF